MLVLNLITRHASRSRPGTVTKEVHAVIHQQDVKWSGSRNVQINLHSLIAKKLITIWYHSPFPFLCSNTLQGLLSRLVLLDLRNNKLLKIQWVLGRRPSLDNLSLLVDQKLLKVPLDSLQVHQSWLLSLHPLPKWIRAITIDLGLSEDWEGNSVVQLAELGDLVIAAWLLASELVAWEAEDLKLSRILLVELFVEGLEAAVLWGEAAFGGGVDDEEDLALVVGKWLWGALL